MQRLLVGDVQIGQVGGPGRVVGKNSALFQDLALEFFVVADNRCGDLGHVFTCSLMTGRSLSAFSYQPWV